MQNKASPFPLTDTGYRLGDLEILFGISGAGGILRSNSLVLHGPRKIVVDPSGSEEKHSELAKENPVLFYTHYHGDHRMAEHCYAETSEVWTSDLDADAVASLEICAEKIGGTNAQATQMMAKAMNQFMKLRDWHIERKMIDTEILEHGGCQAELFHLPGHTPGHMGFFFPEQSLLFITDIDLTDFGPWYGNDVSDKNDFRASVKKARDFECDWYYTSHGEEILDREQFLEKIDAFDAHFDRRDNLLMDALAQGEKSIEELCKLELVYRKASLEKRPHMAHMEKIHVDFHLRDLEERGMITSDEQFQNFCLA